MTPPEDAGFGVYVHWPFCQSKCPYCDFNSHVASRVDQDRWAGAYIAEIRRVGALTAGKVVRSVFFGGGTPSLMNPDVVDAVLTAVRAAWPMSNDPEITLEANPSSVEAGRFRAYAEAGVNRISMGVQALNDADLRRLGRLHSATEARAAFAVAREAFPRVSFDLIYARQDQTLRTWESELTEALRMAVDHLSLYQLTIEDGTAFGARHAAGGLHGLPDDDLSADMYLKTQDICDRFGLSAYEVSNHARPGAESRHNLIYWRSGDYAGIGPGAHGRLTLGGERFATEAVRMPDAWLDQISTQGTGDSLQAALGRAEQADECLLMGLRLSEGMDLRRYLDLRGAPAGPAARTPTAPAVIATLVDDGLLWHSDGRVGATNAGRPVLNALIRAIATG